MRFTNTGVLRPTTGDTYPQPQVEWGISLQWSDKLLRPHAVLLGSTASWASEVITWIFCLVLAKTQPSTALLLLLAGRWQSLWLSQQTTGDCLHDLLRIQTPSRHRRYHRTDERQELIAEEVGVQIYKLKHNIPQEEGVYKTGRITAEKATIMHVLISFSFSPFIHQHNCSASHTHFVFYWFINQSTVIKLCMPQILGWAICLWFRDWSIHHTSWTECLTEEKVGRQLFISGKWKAEAYH